MNTFPRTLHRLITRKCFSTSGTSSGIVAQKYVFVKHFQGEPKEENFKVEEERLPALRDGEYICEAEYLSVDPYMRAYMIRYPLGITMIGGQVAKVIQSKSSKFPVGSRVVGSFGWRTHTLVSEESDTAFGKPYILPDIGNLSSSLGIGVLGMPGHTAYCGLLEICKPKEGETLVITGAAGAVGSHVGQIAKIKGLKTIGFAGSDDKCEWLTKDLGFDYAFNYKKVSVPKVLKEAAPKGVDCYFDNVGGQISSSIFNRMNTYGRVAVCGAISTYNEDLSKVPMAPIIQPVLVVKQLRIEGFLVNRWLNNWLEPFNANLKWIQEGKLKYREHVTDGFGNMVNALNGVLRGDNTGKAIVKV